MEATCHRRMRHHAAAQAAAAAALYHPTALYRPFTGPQASQSAQQSAPQTQLCSILCPPQVRVTQITTIDLSTYRYIQKY